MQKLMKAMHKNEKGFTLVELMVVVVIIGILVAIAIPIFNSVQANAALRACEANQRTIEGAANMYFSEVGLWPALADLYATATLNDGTVVGPWLQEVQNCPRPGGTNTGAYAMAATDLGVVQLNCDHAHYATP